MAASFTFAVSAHLSAVPNFEDDVFPIFEQSCTNCHNPDKQKGDLDLTSYSAMMRGGSGGKVAEPGEGADSRLYGVITHTLKPKMPPKGDKLGKKEADIIRAWIDAGLLEDKSGKPKKKSKPAFSMAAAPSAGKPEGPPPMPSHLLLEPVVLTDRASAIADMAVSPWAPLLAVTGQQQVLLYHTSTLELVGILPFDRGQPVSLSFHPSGKYLLAGGGVGGKSGTTMTWEIATGKQVLTAGKDYDTVLAASLRADLGGVALGGPGKRVKLWDTSADEQQISIKKHTDWVTQLAYSPDGVLLASGGRGGGVYVWESEAGNEFYNLRGQQAAITGLAWRTDSNLLASASEDGSVLVWNMSNGKQVKKIPAHNGGVLALDWNLNGGGFLVTSGRDKKVKIWKPDFKQVKELPPFSNVVTEVAISQDGRRVFAADLDGAITVWNVQTGKQEGTLSANPPSIAERIKHHQEQVVKLPAEVASRQKSYQQAEVLTKAAKTELTQIEKDYREAQEKKKQLLAQRTKLDGQLKGLYAEVKTMAEQRQEQQGNLNQARKELKEYNTALANVRRDFQQLEKSLVQLENEEKRLAAHLQKRKKLADEKPDDEPAKQAAEKAQKALDQHREKIAERKKQSQKKSTALAQLSKQQKGPGNRLAEAEAKWKEIDGKWQALHAKRKLLQDQRNGLNEPLAKTLAAVKSNEQKIKPTKEKLTKLDAAMKKAKTDLTTAQAALATGQSKLKRWQAAAINTQAIQLRKEAAELTHEYHTAMDTFTTLAAEIQQLKDPSKLRGKTRSLIKLRAEIDELAPAVLEKANRAKVRMEQYLTAASPR